MTKQTTAELIVGRADAAEANMALTSHTNEEALESAIEQWLTGISPLLGTGENAPGCNNEFYVSGTSADFNIDFALDERLFFQFLQTSQTAELEKLQNHSPADWQRKILDRFDRLIKKHSVLHLLKNASTGQTAKYDGQRQYRNDRNPERRHCA